MDNVNRAYEIARETYASFGVDTDNILEKISSMKISLHCWQGDDVTGFEKNADGISGGGIMATGNYPGRARNADELRQDLDAALGLIPGRHKVNLHAIYAETGSESIERNKLEYRHFEKWVEWAVSKGIGLDFNPSFFSHELASSGYTLSSKNDDVRKFWIEHAKRCRRIAAEIGEKTGSACVNNIWIPDGSKDLPSDRLEHRRLLLESLDEIFSEKFDESCLVDTVECKLFGIGSESFVVGSHEFYMGYAMTRNVALCLDMGHFHPTESIADKISSILTFSEKLLLHVSRGVRWDSDHVVILNDDLYALAHELKRCNAYENVHFALDFFDASINRITAWVTGTRSALKAVLFSLLEPTHLLADEENSGNLGNRLALMEEFKTLPFGAVWDKYCLEAKVPVRSEWLKNISEYEQRVLFKRN